MTTPPPSPTHIYPGGPLSSPPLPHHHPRPAPAPQDFGVSLYFVVVTISTVGYGDYSPSSPAGRAVVCFMIIGFMVIVPVKISELADLLAMRSPWHTSYTAKRGYRNILVIGSVLEASEVEAFLEEFFHPDRMKVRDVLPPRTA